LRQRDEGTTFLTLVAAPEQVPAARLLIESLRSFGGPFASAPFWVVEADPRLAPCGALEESGATVFRMPERFQAVGYPFSLKVNACAAAEERAAGSVETLCWLIPECLVLRPPALFALPTTRDVAVRPVHIRNVGLPEDLEPDSFWRGVYDAAGEPDRSFTVRSFVEDAPIRPYFNTAALSVRPDLGLFRRWHALFEQMVSDADYQRRACHDDLHRIFLHQAILSTLIATTVPRERIALLPPGYGYPYNLHSSVPEERRVASLGDTVCPIYEERTVDPRAVDDIEIPEPLSSWLLRRTGTPID
jgi:hypothetical protein